MVRPFWNPLVVILDGGSSAALRPLLCCRLKVSAPFAAWLVLWSHCDSWIKKHQTCNVAARAKISKICPQQIQLFILKLRA